MQVPTLKQKLTVSRALATTLKNRIFMRTLYELLDDEAYSSILCWDASGKKVLIKDTENLISEVLPKFERCVTLINFFRRMEECRFYETFERDFGASYVFENLFFTREKKPTFDVELKKKVVYHPEENPPVKKVHKPTPAEAAEDLQTLARFEELLQQQINQRIQLIRSKLVELDSDLQLSGQVKKLINTLQAERLLSSMPE